jgi:anti-sigma factor RsiW
MDHSQFKANQTAANYVAHDLDEHTQEAFELHMMDCTECLDDVELWRAIKVEMPGRYTRAQPDVPVRAPDPAPYSAPPVAQAARTPHPASFIDWRLAASLLVGGIVGAAGGWYGKAARGTDLESDQTLVFNVPAVTRGGGECTVLRLAPDTRVAVLRVPGVSRDMRVTAVDAERHEIPAGGEVVRVQPDGSQLLKLDSRLLDGKTVELEARRADSIGEPLGCVTGDTSVH